jgi:cysteine desulfurase
MNRIYLDNAATTPLDPMVILNAHPAEIFFTSGGTESSNTAIFSAVRDLACRHIITSEIEHHAVSHAVEYLKNAGKATVSYVKLLPNGHIDLDDLEKLLSESSVKTLVTLMHANNEIGNMLDIHAVGNVCNLYNAVFHSDTVQTVGHLPFDLRKTPVHFITGSAHKFHGPKGVGILYINENIRIQPFIHGGGQERNMRAGTENIYGIVGLAKALEIATAEFEADRTFIHSLKLYMYEALKKNIPGIDFNGDVFKKSLYTILNVSFPVSEKSEMLLFNLDIHHICASGGSACASGADQGSHVIRAINADPNQIAVRFSFSKHNTTEEIDRVVAMLKRLI